jgi:DNA polymerase III subunit beta
MKIRCEKDQLLTAVQIVQKAAANKTTLPILTGIYLSAANGLLELQATDYEVGISMTIPAEIIESGKAVLSGKFFPEIIRKISGKSIEIFSVANSSMITVASDKTEFRILSFPADEFPIIKKFESNNLITLKDDILKDLIKKTVFACSTDESRPLFTGAMTEVLDNEIIMVATNTHRLALKKHTISTSSTELKMIIPGKLLNEISKIINFDDPTDVHIYWLKNQVAFSFENIYVMSRVIEGQFPDYKKVIPSEFTSFCTVEANSLFDAVERVSLLAKDGEYNIIRIKFTDNTMELSGNNPDAGSAIEVLEVSPEGETMEIAFNAKYLLDVLRIAGSGKIKFHLKSPLSPVMIKLLDDGDYTYILTPIRTN